MDDSRSGACLCGAVQYRVDGEPLFTGYCHCASCRRHTGSAVAAFVGFRREQVSFASDTLAHFGSSPGVSRGFCAKCGTPVCYEAETYPGEIHLYIGTLNDPARFKPTFHVFHANRIPWFDTADTLPRHPGLPDEAPS
jgi:hypothetical protein